MAPTLDWAEGFEHRADTGLSPSGTAVYNVAVSRPGGVSYPAGRLGGVCVQLVEDGSTATSVRQDPPASTLRWFAGWINIATAPSADRSAAIIFQQGTTVAANLTVRSAANGSVLEMQPDAGVRQTGPNICDGNWHLIEIRVDSTTGTVAVDWRVDGVAQTQATASLTSANIDRIQFGSTAAGNTLTVKWDDCIGGTTSSDYTNRTYWTNPSATSGNGWQVALSSPESEGTDVIGSTNAIVKTGGSGAGWDILDDWNGAASDTTSYITYTSTTLGDAASNYVEVVMQDKPVGISDIWLVIGNAAAVSASTTASSMIARVRDMDNSADLGDVIPGDISETTVRYWRLKLTTPATGWLAAFNNLRFRVGLSGDTNPLPRITTVGLQYVYPVDSALTTTTVAAIAAIPTPSVTTLNPDASVTPTTVVSISSIPTPTVAGTAAVTPTTVGAIAAVPTPTVAATAAKTPTTVGAITAIPTPTVAGTAAKTTSTVTAIAAVPTPTVAATAAITATTVVAIVSIPTPLVVATGGVTTYVITNITI